jgi:hypothetical protein
MLGVLHGRTGGPFSCLLASLSPVPRDFYRYMGVALEPLRSILILDVQRIEDALEPMRERSPNKSVASNFG